MIDADRWIMNVKKDCFEILPEGISIVLGNDSVFLEGAIIGDPIALDESQLNRFVREGVVGIYGKKTVVTVITPKRESSSVSSI